MELKSDPLLQPVPGGQATAPAPSDTEAFLRYLCTRSEEQLQGMIREIQPRLGTSAEDSHDFEAVQHIAHQLNNLRTCAELSEALSRL